MRQLLTVSLLNFRNLRRRLWQSLVIVIGMACVSTVLLSMQSVTKGLEQAYAASGDPRNVIIVSRGSTRLEGSAIPRDQAVVIENAPGIARDASGAPLSDAGFATFVPAALAKNGVTRFAELSTMGPMGPALHPGFHLIAGRMARSGTQEVMVGKLAAATYQGMALGGKVTMPNGAWPIVGIFSTGDLLDSDVVGDTETVMQAMRATNYNIITARLAAPGAFAGFRRLIIANPLLTTDVMRLADWNALAGADRTAFFNAMIYGVSIILAVGALFACFNTMYAAVESRAREIATLRAIGYGGFAVAASVVLEASALTIAGALFGAAIAWSLYNGVQGDMGGWEFFKLTVSPAMIAMAVGWALIVAILGSLLPSFRAARWSVADALRAR